MLNVDFCSYFANIFGIYLDTISALAGGCALTWRSFFHSCTDVWGSIKFAYLVYSWALSSVQCIWFDVEQVFREVTETVCGEREKRKKRFTTMRLASHYYRDTPPPLLQTGSTIMLTLIWGLCHCLSVLMPPGLCLAQLRLPRSSVRAVKRNISTSFKK